MRIRFDKLTLRHDAPVDEFEVDLHSGRFVLRQTDFFISDVMPLSQSEPTVRETDMAARLGQARNTGEAKKFFLQNDIPFSQK